LYYFWKALEAYCTVNQYVHTPCKGKSHDKIFDKIFVHILMRLINDKGMRTIILCYYYSNAIIILNLNVIYLFAIVSRNIQKRDFAQKRD